MDETLRFVTTFPALATVGWKFKRLDDKPLNAFIKGVVILSFRPSPGKAVGLGLLSPSNLPYSPYNAPLDTPEEKGWWAAEALTEYLRSDLGLQSTQHAALDNLKGDPLPPFDKLNLPRDVVLIQVGLSNREFDLKMLGFEEEFEEEKRRMEP